MDKIIYAIGGEAIMVDENMYETLNDFSWRVQYVNDARYRYAVTNDLGDGPVLMHRLVAIAPEGSFCDHINHNTLDNRLENLRTCTSRLNQGNRKKQKGTSQYKGVCWYKSLKKWKAQIRVDGKKTHLGYFDLERQAALAYDKAAKKVFGEYAKTNF